MSNVTIHRGFRYRLGPTSEQEAQFRQFAGVCRLVYNLALEQRSTWWRQYRCATGGTLNAVSQGRELTVLRAEFDWIAAVPQQCQAAVLRDLDWAFDAFFTDRARYPRPRRKFTDDAFRFEGRRTSIRPINGRWSAVRLPNITVAFSVRF